MKQLSTNIFLFNFFIFEKKKTIIFLNAYTLGTEIPRYVRERKRVPLKKGEYHQKKSLIFFHGSAKKLLTQDKTCFRINVVNKCFNDQQLSVKLSMSQTKRKTLKTLNFNRKREATKKHPKIHRRFAKSRYRKTLRKHRNYRVGEVIKASFYRSLVLLLLLSCYSSVYSFI